MKRLCVCLGVLMMCIGVLPTLAQEEVSPVEVNGDNVTFDIREHKVIASGNVSVIKGDTRLACDRVEYYRKTQIAHAHGRVVLERGNGYRLEGEELVFNFQTLKGDFERPLLTAPPLYGAGQSVERQNDEFFRIHNGFISTCDFDVPQWRVNAKTIDVYPGDVAVARNMVLRIGTIPVFYWPKYTEDLKNRSSIVRITPGYQSDWGAFLLTRWRFDRNENFKTFVHVDYRERRDLAWGIDNAYQSDVIGSGALRTYYMNERMISADRIWDERTSPTIEQERYKVEWRHRWEPDDSTMVMAQFYKLSDSEILKDYFESEYERDPIPDSYFVMTQGLRYGTIGARADYRVNRFTSTVDRLPELSYTLPSLEIFDTNVYWKNSTTLSSLWKKNASPTDTYAKTKRVHINNELSYPAKVSFVEVRPFVGTRHTYYSRTKEPMLQDVVRGIFRTGVDLSTKFYRIYETQTDAWGLEINRLRHVITPSVAYEYQDDPTVQASELDYYDAIDAYGRVHKAVFSIENKLQTKRNGQNVDLVRLILSADYALKQDADLPSGYNNLGVDLELQPYEWLGFYFDATHNPQDDDLVEANFDLYINNPGDRWYVRLGERYHHLVDNQFEAEIGWAINPKWSVQFNQIFDGDTGKNERQDFIIRRDLHSWLMDISFSNRKDDGQEILFMFSLKGFDDVKFEGGHSFGGGSEKPGAH